MDGERRGQLKRKAAVESLPFPASSRQLPEQLTTVMAKPLHFLLIMRSQKLIKTDFDKDNSGNHIFAATTTSPDPSLKRFFTLILPQVFREIKHWNRRLDHCADRVLLRQALLSMKQKRFHAQGGCFYALYNPGYSKQLVSVIVALQTMSDYLDNLCDRGEIYSEAAFRCLHLAMSDALPGRPSVKRDYYRFYRLRHDGGYLQELVIKCRQGIALFPAYPIVQKDLLTLVSLYNDLQVYKHLHPRMRHSRLKRWFREKGSVVTPPVYFWEFAAACGSTLAIYALLGLATFANTTTEEVRRLVQVYFPWVCGLHILLDYWIDQEEDRLEGDYNFAACYPSPEIATQRLLLFLNKSLEGVSQLPHSSFHRTIIRGLLAVYLSDPKVTRQGFRGTANTILNAAGSETKLLYHICLLLRKTMIL